MDVEFIRPFVMSISRVFETMVHTKVKVGKPLFKQDGLGTISVEVALIPGKKKANTTPQPVAGAVS